MDPLAVIVLTLVFITILTFSRKVPIFIVLFSGAVFLGLLAGYGFEEVMKWAIEGMGSIFSAFAIIILSGSVIVRMLSDQDLLDVIVSDIRGKAKNPDLNAGLIGYILAIPTTCCITTYMMFAPAMKKTGDTTSSNRPLYILAIGSIISYVLIFPTPATIPLLTGLAPQFSVLNFDAVAIPLSFAVLLIIIFLSRYWYSAGKEEEADEP